ncbi:MAG TPA: aspartate--ammonia ligase [Williamwhitmania sp.]|nr:aspartate--ammonia ligase [Williamwhitmania sp.]
MKTLLESKSLQQEFLAAEDALWSVKGYFVDRLRKSLNLTRVTAPMLVEAGTGINDDLNGIERPLGFSTKALEGRRVEVVQSLAKWKRLKLADAGIEPGRGIVTDMRAIRPDEVLSHIHSLYVDQWDWEMVMEPQQRNLDFLQLIVTRLYAAIRDTEHYVSTLYPEIRPILPTAIKFIHAEDLQAQFPDLSPRERETEATKEHGAVFIIGIGGKLANGEPYDGRAPDYDDWSTETLPGKHGLNGDIVVWNPVLQSAYELSSMGIRVDAESLVRQLSIADAEQRMGLYFHSRLLKGELPQTIGGGIGQSRLAMFLLRKSHIGEVQASVWPEEDKTWSLTHGFTLL